MGVFDVQHYYFAPYGNDRFCNGKVEIPVNKVHPAGTVDYDWVRDFDTGTNKQGDTAAPIGDPRVDWVHEFALAEEDPDGFYRYAVDLALPTAWEFPRGSSELMGIEEGSLVVRNIHDLGTSSTTVRQGGLISAGDRVRVFATEVTGYADNTHSTRTLIVTEVDYARNRIKYIEQDDGTVFDDDGQFVDDWEFKRGQLVVVCNSSLLNRNVDGPLHSLYGYWNETTHGGVGRSVSRTSAVMFHFKPGVYRTEFTTEDPDTCRHLSACYVSHGESIHPIEKTRMFHTDQAYDDSNTFDNVRRAGFFNFKFDVTVPNQDDATPHPWVGHAMYTNTGGGAPLYSSGYEDLNAPVFYNCTFKGFEARAEIEEYNRTQLTNVYTDSNAGLRKVFGTYPQVHTINCKFLNIPRVAAGSRTARNNLYHHCGIIYPATVTRFNGCMFVDNGDMRNWQDEPFKTFTHQYTRSYEQQGFMAQQGGTSHFLKDNLIYYSIQGHDNSYITGGTATSTGESYFALPIKNFVSDTGTSVIVDGDWVNAPYNAAPHYLQNSAFLLGDEVVFASASSYSAGNDETTFTIKRGVSYNTEDVGREHGQGEILRHIPTNSATMGYFSNQSLATVYAASPQYGYAYIPVQIPKDIMQEILSAYDINLTFDVSTSIPDAGLNPLGQLSGGNYFRYDDILDDNFAYRKTDTAKDFIKNTTLGVYTDAGPENSILLAHADFQDTDEVFKSLAGQAYTFDDSSTSLFYLRQTAAGAGIDAGYGQNLAVHPYLKYNSTDKKWEFKDEYEFNMTNNIDGTTATVVLSSSDAVSNNVDVGDILVIPHDLEVPGVDGEYVRVVESNVNGSVNEIRIQRSISGAPGIEVDPTLPLSAYGMNEHAFKPYKVKRHLQTTKLFTKTIELGIDGEKFLKFDMITDNYNTTGTFTKSLNPNVPLSGAGVAGYKTYVAGNDVPPVDEYTGATVSAELFTDSDVRFVERVVSFPDSHYVYRHGDLMATVGVSGGNDIWMVTRNDSTVNNNDVQVKRGMLNTELNASAFGSLQEPINVTTYPGGVGVPGTASAEIKVLWTDRQATQQIVDHPSFDNAMDDSVFMTGFHRDNYAILAHNTDDRNYSAIQNYKQYDYVVNDTGMFLGYFPKNSPMDKLVGANRIAFEIDFIFRG